MSRVEDQMLLMFDHPTEPIYVPKGDDKVSFNIPPTYLPDNYQSIAQRILTRFGNESNSTVRIKQIAVPDLSVPLKLPRNAGFSNMIPSHRSMAGHLTSLFMGMRTVEDLLSLAAYCHDRINPQMFVYSLSVALINRPDTKGIRIPQLTEVFPHKFVDSNVFARANEMVNIMPERFTCEFANMPIEIPLNWTASDVDPEHRVAYFREDVGINLHHWHWHLIYPMDGPMVVVNKDRRGELFYHMHHQIMARYNVERLCNGLPLAVPLVDLREQIPEAYFPKMDQTVAGRAWPARVANMVLSNLNRRVDGVQLALTDLEKWRNNIYDAIASGRVTNTQGQVIVLDEVKGIDVLGNIVESSIISPNSAVYGDLHNQGHLALAYIHDPDHRYLESFGIMGDTATAMRDPVFYRWHQFVDNIFTQFKNTLQPYTAQTLNFPGISLTDIRITSDGANPNTLNCYWSKSDIDLSRGLDFSPRGSVFTRIQHLNHDEFSYTLQVNNTNNSDLTGTVRIFIGPKFDLNGYPLSFNQQRQLMIEMDKFTARLNRGQNTINRTSVQSNLTIPFEATFRDLSQNRPATTDIQDSESFNFCGCGWPHHMLCPKGNAAGYQMDLFIMISDYRIDQVKQASPTGCADGISFCGLRDLKYPDTRAMGFPFDRSSPQGVRTISEFLTPNMRLQSITVRFTDTIKPRQQVTKARKRTG